MIRSRKPDLASTDILDHDGIYYDGWCYSRADLAAILSPGEQLSERTRNGRAGLETTAPAHLCDVPDCRAVATEERVVSELVHRMCARCAAELDAGR